MSTIRFVVRQGPNPGQVFELQQPVLSVGRSKDNEIQIDDSKISRRHASLTQTGAGYTLQDLGSTNGTFVNNQRITTPVLIQPGDVIGFGDSVVVDVQGAMDIDQTVASPRAAISPAYIPPPPAYAPSPAAYAPPPPPQPAGFEPAPQSRAGRNIAVGCGILLLLLVCVIAAGLLVYQFAPPDIAAPICDILRPLGLGAFCQ